MQQGAVSDGDGQILPGSDNCEWIIAPVGAESIELHFEFFDMTPDYNYDYVVIDVCSDVECSTSTALTGSPFKSFPNNAPVLDLPTASSGFVRVSYPTIWSGHTQARFVLRYVGVSSRLLANATCPGLYMDSWIHLSVVVEGINSSAFGASMYVNGTLVAGPIYGSHVTESGSPFAGESGAALGRVFPMSSPFGYFSGGMDNLVLISKSLSGPDLDKLARSACAHVPQAISCFSFERSLISMNGTFVDTGCCEPADAIPVSEDKFLPWCVTRNDDGYILVEDITSELLVEFEQSWGFCTNQTRVPGLDFDYVAEELGSLQSMLSDESNVLGLTDLSGCTRIPLLLEGNSAKR